MTNSSNKKFRFAFAGLRHPHIFSLLERVKGREDCEIVAAWEGDAQTRKELEAEGKVTLNYDDFDAMLANSGCNIVAIADAYAERGKLAIAALRAGCHVIGDKPLCTSLEELEQIEKLAAEKGLSVGCQLDLTEAAPIRKLQEVVRKGQIGKVQTVTILAQHPLRYGTRAGWYFEPGMHGGTINDIGVHVFDLLPWLTGSQWQGIIHAREWNAKAEQVPHFADCAQVYGLLESGATCFVDLSYLAPDRCGYALPQYWRITVHGTLGFAEASYGGTSLTLVTDADEAAQEIGLSVDESCPSQSDAKRDYLGDFLAEVSGKPATGAEALNTEKVIHTARLALEAQKLAQS